MKNIAAQLEAAAHAAENSTRDPHQTVRALVEAVRKAAADIKPSKDDDAPAKGRK